ncbi:hypothetical protein GUJ93_ZPchr0013g34025 [Zizania palustris]|uniref:Transcription factor TFIIB cyclin-like domain-containing protein n=1 Tax=Zizania palustris TaxID=103762 RepID=A0A8J5WZG8_ZIZPA|nr:hypothetical protein GUJ93_ZPchr0013g34025 [Zizania palustris]
MEQNARLRNVRRAPPHSCARLVLERHLHTHPFFPLLPSLHPLPLVTLDLADSAPSSSPSAGGGGDDDDPFLPAGLVSAFSAFSLERHPVLARSASAFSGLLAELERALAVESTASSTPDPAGPMVSVDRLRAYLQIVDVASILRLDWDIADHAFELFKDCSSATCLRNRSVEALATAALVQAIREAQEPRTLQSELGVAAFLYVCSLQDSNQVGFRNSQGIVVSETEISTMTFCHTVLTAIELQLESK